ncbi:MAG: ABC transporter substrate-binding protein [Deltaproteobacteria bacterium]|nr:ABC transporter substrate-binding protein [Deltaproteobacteria bacterium]MCW8893418.1 ABC transporter substrate-binding protein [Deltaproteobacteria bacterium]
MKKRLLAGLLILLFSVPSFALPEPQAQVETMVNSVLSVMQSTEMSPEEKKLQISGRVQKFLNVESMSRRTLGAYWDGATEEQREHFSQLFVRVLEGTYLSRIEDYSDGAVQYLKQRVKEDKAIIDTVIVSKELEIPVQYKMIYTDGSWQVFDLVIEGVSLVRNYRESYGEIIRRDGYDGLFALMEEKVGVIEKKQTIQ